VKLLLRRFVTFKEFLRTNYLFGAEMEVAQIVVTKISEAEKQKVGIS
jgi:hypothetical protein